MESLLLRRLVEVLLRRDWTSIMYIKCSYKHLMYMMRKLPANGMALRNLRFHGRGPSLWA